MLCKILPSTAMLLWWKGGSRKGWGLGILSGSSSAPGFKKVESEEEEFGSLVEVVLAAAPT